jgi:cytochrome c peroxidase
VRSQIDSIFAASVARVRSALSADREHQIRLLGKILLNDRNLSVNRNVACATCHSNDTGFTGPVDIINRTVVAYPGSAGQLVSARKPQSYGYATFAPMLRYSPMLKDFYGGNFWDMRATGLQLTNPAAEQALGPPLNPLEMALPDAACVVYRIARSDYRGLFEKVWGGQSFAITWPRDVERVCSTPAPAASATPLGLSPTDRGTANTTYNFMVMAIASFEASPDVSPFSSKFDSAVAHPERQILSADEQAGWALFRGKAGCNTCHLDGTQSAPQTRTTDDGLTLADAADVAPLFTDFTSANLGVPRNPALRYYCESSPNAAGYTPNPEGDRFVDRGVGGFLRSKENPSRNWAGNAGRFDGAFRVPTLRNVDMRPRPDFTKAYMHNGYLKSLKEVVHFYNTRDVLPRCREPNDPGEKVRCWPPPEVNVNVDSTVGRLGLTEREEDQLVAFLKTLTDRPRPE